MITRDGYKSDLDGLNEMTREGGNDLHIITTGYSGLLALHIEDDEGAFRRVHVSMTEDQVRMLVDDLNKWLASAATVTREEANAITKDWPIPGKTACRPDIHPSYTSDRLADLTSTHLDNLIKFAAAEKTKRKS